ncbi:uncharacterized protein LOC121853800 [Homarus americanus]|uniref:Uncharacterized protein n=1 Tax=Homarus americanus TaxID=6706 RepID=A0A8J5JEJ8_HOMAM|nr:uncharacterized protein LOC121853800 [Homarus americanus]KAG7156270.1 hypothetical protein Hamer_G005990 [Homarus americanus]
MTTDDAAPLSANHTASSSSTNETLGSFRSLKILKSDLASIFNQVDVSTVGKVLLLTVFVLLIYDLLVYLLASISSRKRLLVTPWLTQILANSWDDLNQRGSFARSHDAIGPLLKSLAHTAAKYEGRWEKSRLL